MGMSNFVRVWFFFFENSKTVNRNRKKLRFEALVYLNELYRIIEDNIIIRI